MSMKHCDKGTKEKQKHENGGPSRLKEKYKEMKESIKIFRRDLEESLTTDKVLVNGHFRQNFYRALENLIRQMELMRDENSKAKRVELIYGWYKKKLQFFEDISHIDRRTHKSYYEVLPDINLYQKDDYYEARNFPIDFEKDFRTEIEGVIPKQKLVEFKRRMIEEKEKEASKMTQKIEKKLDLLFDSKDLNLLPRSRFNSTHTSFDQSTNYNTRYGKTFRDTDPYREIRSSNGNYVPQYNFVNVDLNKKWLDEKHKEVSEKRNAEEMKSFINDWAFEKGKLIGEVERKHEMLVMLKNYEEMNKKEKDQIVSNPNLEEEYKDNSSTKVSNIRNLHMDSIKKSFDLSNKKTKIFDINTGKESPFERTDNIVQDLKSKIESLPLDASISLAAHDKVLKTRKSYGTMVDVAEISNMKDGYIHHLKPLSLYDVHSSLNTKKLIKKDFKILNNKMMDYLRPNTNSVDLKLTSTENNMLKQRRTLSTFTDKEVSSLKSDLVRHSVEIPLHVLKGGLLPPKDTGPYEKTYLPTGGFGFLQNPFPEGKKAKR